MFFFEFFPSTIEGRDKFCRLVQYSSKAMKWRCEEAKAPEEQIKVWNELMASMSLVRKVLRFFKTIAVLRQLRAAIPQDTRYKTNKHTIRLVFGRF